MRIRGCALRMCGREGSPLSSDAGMGMNIYTIGHSNHSWETFVELLRENGIEVVVDVRSKPVSRFAPFSNKRVFPNLLETIGIEYYFMGDSLGGRPDNQTLYAEDGKPDYHKMAGTELFKDGVSQLLRMMEDSVTAMMCSEEDPTKCHRRLLIGVALGEHGVECLHIRKGGMVVREEALIGESSGKSELQGRLMA